MLDGYEDGSRSGNLERIGPELESYGAHADEYC
jgi:hypothetical protein